MNSLEYIIKERLKGDMKEKEKGLLVEVPIVTRPEIEAVIKSHDKPPLD
jgi:hypothetical protein